MTQPFASRTDAPLPAGGLPPTPLGGSPTPGGAGRTEDGRWRPLLLAGVALLLAGAVLLPWARASVPPPPHPEPGSPFPLTATLDGLAAGSAPWGWATLACAALALVLGLIGAARRSIGASVCAIVPGVGAVTALLLAVPGLLAQKLPDPVKLMVLGRGSSLAVRQSVFALLDKETSTSLDWGWALALVLALLIPVLGLSSLLTRPRR